jgi:hypothetical protein
MSQSPFACAMTRGTGARIMYCANSCVARVLSMRAVHRFTLPYIRGLQTTPEVPWRTTRGFLWMNCGQWLVLTRMHWMSCVAVPLCLTGQRLHVNTHKVHAENHTGTCRRILIIRSQARANLRMMEKLTQTVSMYVADMCQLLVNEDLSTNCSKTAGWAMEVSYFSLRSNTPLTCLSHAGVVGQATA